jgi:hypothetical protein
VDDPSGREEGHFFTFPDYRTPYIQEHAWLDETGTKWQQIVWDFLYPINGDLEKCGVPLQQKILFS